MGQCGLTVGISVIANAIAENLSDDELALLGSAFNQLGDTLSTIAAQRALCNNIKSSKDSSEDTSNSNTDTSNDTSTSNKNTSNNTTNSSEDIDSSDT